MQSVWRQAVQLDTRLAQPEVGRKALSPFVTAAGHPWLIAPLPLIRLIENRQAGSSELRFDVVGIVRRRGEQPRLTHLRGAF